jgi:hypothetical protein
MERMKRLHHVCVVSFLVYVRDDAEAEPYNCAMRKWVGGGYASRGTVELV